MSRKCTSQVVDSAPKTISRLKHISTPATGKQPDLTHLTRSQTKMTRIKGSSTKDILSPVESSVDLARLCAGYVSGLFGFLVIGLISSRIIDLSELSRITEFRIFLCILLAKLIGLLSICYLSYTLLGMAERLLLPNALLSGGPRFVSTIRTVLGVKPPVEAALEVGHRSLTSSQEQSSLSGKPESQSGIRSGDDVAFRPPLAPPK